MTRIIIELDGSSVQPYVSVTAAPEKSSAHLQSATAQERPNGPVPPVDVLAQAAALGAINGGAGPSSIAAAGASAPIASSLGGAPSVSSQEVASAGPATQDVFATTSASGS
jgi:hypothetical protein